MVLLYGEEFGLAGEGFRGVLRGILTPTFNTYQEKYMSLTWIGCWGWWGYALTGFGSYVLLGGGRG